jgi:Formate hydrogenlyase subunit 6/NADH:ubiquinone oxidoreductase 23 kD subunit (chain I)
MRNNGTLPRRRNGNMNGNGVRKNCETGCIGCKRCEKACDAHAHAITIVDNLAIIDPDKCDNCYDCVSVCPRGTIVRINQPEKKTETEKVLEQNRR